MSMAELCADVKCQHLAINRRWRKKNTHCLLIVRISKTSMISVCGFHFYLRFEQIKFPNLILGKWRAFIFIEYNELSSAPTVHRSTVTVSEM